MKKRVFAVFIAVVMIATAINVAPVLEVLASDHFSLTQIFNINKNGNYASEKIWDYGYWDQPVNCTTDRMYTHITLEGRMNHQGGTSRDREAAVSYAAENGADVTHTYGRHVTMFHNCDPWSNTQLSGYQYTHNLKIPFMDPISSSNDTPRSGTNKFKIEVANKADGYWHVDESGYDEDKTIWTNQPLLNAWCAGGDRNTGYDFQDKENTNHQWTTQYAMFTPRADKNGLFDIRMCFRNFNNTDYTLFNDTKKNGTRVEGKLGIDFSAYDYLEFDLYIDPEMKLIFNDPKNKPLDTAQVLLYHETNDGMCGTTKDYTYPLDYTLAEGLIPGWQNASGENTNFLTALTAENVGSWQTVRMSLSHLPNGTSNVKQITLRVKGYSETKNATLGGNFRIDNIRLVKNDTHIPYVHSTFGGYEQQSYPSGKYFMINDFEYVRSAITTWEQKGLYTGFNKVGNAANYVQYPTYRLEDATTNSTMLYSTPGKVANAWSGMAWGDPTNSKTYLAKQGIITQGTYGTTISNRGASNVYQIQSGTDTWNSPICYERQYDGNKLPDISDYTHFSMDVYIRSRGGGRLGENSNYGIGKLTNSTANGVTFAIELLGGSDYHTAYQVQFLLPYNKACWDVDSFNLPNNYGTIVPLVNNEVINNGSENQVINSYFNTGKNSDQTDSGSLRLTFTRADLMAGIKDANVDLSQITGMRFYWMNDNNKPEFNTHNSTITCCDITLDNFVAYTPDTSVTIKNEVADEQQGLMDNNQSFVYTVYSGYRATESGYIQNELGDDMIDDYNGVNDFITKDVNTTVSIPANGSFTLKNVPFNSLYISQDSGAWRYRVGEITCNKTGVIKSYQATNPTDLVDKTNNATATVLPRVSLDSSGASSVPIWKVMTQRNFTVTFKQRYLQYFESNQLKNNTKWLDGADTKVNTFG